MKFEIGVHSAVRFTAEPQDVTVFEGATAYFNCDFEGTNTSPVWRINRIRYPWWDPPSGYTVYSGFSIRADHVSLSMNNTPHQCILTERSSAVGILYVKPCKLYM